MSESRNGQASPSRLKRWLREPLLHFLLIGFLLFGLYGILNPQNRDPLRSNRIELKEDDLRQMTLVWSAQWKRAPTSEELQGLIEGKVREEILAREALAMGLDQGDAIVTRRLAQKMEFLSEDASAVREPEASELKVWFEGKRKRFSLPGSMSFRVVYFSPDLRGPKAQSDAAAALEHLKGEPAQSTSARTSGDSFMLQDYYADRDPQQVAGVFGSRFSEALFRLTPGAWQGPIESGLGWHLVFIESMTAGRVPAFEEIEGDVRAEWLAEQRAESKRKTFDGMRARYEVILPPTVARSP